MACFKIIFLLSAICYANVLSQSTTSTTSTSTTTTATTTATTITPVPVSSCVSSNSVTLVDRGLSFGTAVSSCGTTTVSSETVVNATTSLIIEQAQNVSTMLNNCNDYIGESDILACHLLQAPEIYQNLFTIYEQAKLLYDTKYSNATEGGIVSATCVATAELNYLQKAADILDLINTCVNNQTEIVYTVTGNKVVKSTAASKNAVMIFTLSQFVYLFCIVTLLSI